MPPPKEIPPEMSDRLEWAMYGTTALVGLIAAGMHAHTRARTHAYTHARARAHTCMHAHTRARARACTHITLTCTVLLRYVPPTRGRGIHGTYVCVPVRACAYVPK